MGGKFFVTGVTMVAGILVWVIFVILRWVLRKKVQWSPGVDLVASLATGALIVFSGVT